MSHRFINPAVAVVLAAGAFLWAYCTRDLHFYTNVAFAGVLGLLSLGTFFALATTAGKSISRHPTWAYKISGFVFLASFFGLFVWGLMLWNGSSLATFLARLFWFAIGATLILGLLHLYYQVWTNDDYLRRLHANTFYFGLIFLMSAGMMKYRDPARVDAIGMVSLAVFCLIQAIGLLKRS
ncbi:MAG TPA: hypothetical protein VGL91_18930 [Acidobacteriota bacterium]|jgi:hypothetical protein